ncbi:Far1 [Hordeum vulgare]|nr:Far1 [Hordeum vulgare]
MWVFLLGIGSPPLMVNGATLTLEHVMRRLDAIENKVATIELIENFDKKIHNQITQYGSKMGMVLKNLKEKEPTNTPNFAHNKITKSVFVPKSSAESSSKKDESLKMISDHTTYGLSTKDDDT